MLMQLSCVPQVVAITLAILARQMEARATRPGRRRPRRRSTARETQRVVKDAVARVAARLAGGEAMMRLLAERLDAVAGEADRERHVLEAMLPPVEVLAEAATTQLMWNAKARAEALTEFGALTAAQIAELRGVDTTNPHSTVSRWLQENRIVAVDSSQGRLFPAFQFEEGRPRAIWPHSTASYAVGRPPIRSCAAHLAQ